MRPSPGGSTPSIPCRAPGASPACLPGFAAPTNYVERGAGNPGQPVHHARCRASLRLEGGEWSKAAEVETDSDGRFRVALPLGFTGLFAPEADGIPLLQELALNVAEEVRNELDGYRREFSDAPDAAGYASVRGKLEGYPREFFFQLCDRPEDDFEPLRSALNLLRLSMGLVRSRRRDFGQQRVQIKLVAREVFYDGTGLGARSPLAGGHRPAQRRRGPERRS